MQLVKTKIANSLSPLLKANGYKKRNFTWRKLTTDTFLVFHIEKYRWGANYYNITLGIYIHELGRDPTPSINKCQIQSSLEKLIPDIYDFRQVSDFHYPSYTTAERFERLIGFVSEIALPWLDRYSTFTYLQQLAKNEYRELSSRMLIFRGTYDYLA
jgi:hypothetical protein